MSKKKVAKQLGLTAAVAASAVVAANPASAASASQVETAVVQAEKDAIALGKFYRSTDLEVSADFSAAYNKAKKSIASAKAQVATLTGSQKSLLSARVAAADANRLKAAYYIDAVNFVKGDLAEATAALAEHVKAGEITDETVEVYNNLSATIKKAERVIGKVYGSEVRKAVESSYLLDAKFAREAVIYEVSQYELMQEIADQVAAGELEKAADNFKVLERLKVRAVEIKEAGKKLYPDRTDVYPALPTIETQLRTAETAVVASYEEKLAPAVKSVSAINGSTLEVKFTKAMNAADLITEDANGDKWLNANVFKKADSTLTQTSTYAASLSQDGKTLTILADGSNVVNWDGKYVFTLLADTARTTEGKYLPKSEILVDGKDTVAPTLTKTEKLSASKVRVYFSEPLVDAGSYSITYSNGTSATSKVIVVDTNIAKGYVDLLIDGNEDVGTSYNVSLLGAKDYSNNVISPNPTVFTINKGQKDGVAPTVASVTAVSLNKFTVQFSEEVNVTAGDVKVDGVAVDSLVRDSKDKTKYTATVNAGVTAGIHSVTVDKSVTDLSGEVLSKTSDYAKAVQFSVDTTNPKLVSSDIKTDINGDQYLSLVFDEAVTLADLSHASAKAIKNNVTTVGTLAYDDADLVDVNSDGKTWKLLLNDISFNGSALVEGTNYTFTLSGVADTSSNRNTLSPVSVSFNRGSDASLAAQKLATNNPAVQGASPSKVLVNFDKEVDATTATNVANYTIQGATVTKAEVFNTNTKQVVLTLAADSVTQSGNRNLTVSGVKSSSGVAMSETQTVPVALKENVAPTFTASIVDGDTIKVSFSEAVTGFTPASLADFAVYYDGSSVDTSVATVITTDAAGNNAVTSLAVNTVYIQLDADDIANLSKTVTVKTVGNNIEDINGNAWKSATVTAQ